MHREFGETNLAKKKKIDGRWWTKLLTSSPTHFQQKEKSVDIVTYRQLQNFSP